MEHKLDGLLLVVCLVALGPVVADGVREDVAVAVERRSRDGTADVGETLEAVLRILVPEVECTIGAGGREGSVDGVERDIVDSVDVCHGGLWRLAMALEGEVGAGEEHKE